MENAVKEEEARAVDVAASEGDAALEAADSVEDVNSKYKVKTVHLLSIEST
jgi:hypothetical protein